MQLKENKRKKLGLQLAFEHALKDPENINPSFRPNLGPSQETVAKSYDHGFDQFLKEMSLWKARKEKKLRDLKNQNSTHSECVFKPNINPASLKLAESKRTIAALEPSSRSSSVRRHCKLQPSFVAPPRKVKRIQSMSEFKLKTQVRAELKQSASQQLHTVSQSEIDERRIRERAAEFVEKLTKSIIQQTKESLELTDYEDSRGSEMSQRLNETVVHKAEGSSLDSTFMKILDQEQEEKKARSREKGLKKYI